MSLSQVITYIILLGPAKITFKEIKRKGILDQRNLITTVYEGVTISLRTSETSATPAHLLAVHESSQQSH